MKTLSVAATKAFVVSGSTLLTMFLGKYYGPETLGIFAVGFSAVLLLSIVYRRGAPVLLLRNLVRYEEIAPQSHYNALDYDLVRRAAQRPLHLAFLAGITSYLFFLGQGGALNVFLFLLPIVLFAGQLQLRSVYLKSQAHPLRASLMDMGIINVILAATVPLHLLLRPGQPLSELLIALAIVLYVAWFVSFLRRRERPVAMEILSDAADQRAIVLNALLTFFVRNGYPLVFALFVATADIGYFRLEERVAFIGVFIFMVYETVAIRSLIGAMRGADFVRRKRMYWRSVIAVFGATLGVSLIFAAAAVLPTVQRFVGLSDQGSLQWAVFLAAPFYSIIYLNNLFLNLSGAFRQIAVNMVMTTVLFLTLSAALYSSQGLTGLRIAYFISGIAGAGLTSLLAMKTLPHSRTQGDD